MGSEFEPIRDVLEAASEASGSPVKGAPTLPLPLDGSVVKVGVPLARWGLDAPQRFLRRLHRLPRLRQRMPRLGADPRLPAPDPPLPRRRR